MTQALLVVDVQNEFSPRGLRAVPNHTDAMIAIHEHIANARRDKAPIAWIQHQNKPTESRAFVPGSWGAELSPGIGPQSGYGAERLFTKDVFGAFTGTGLEAWLASLGVTEVTIVGFFAHMCVSTSAREALVRGLAVRVDANAVGARDLEHDSLGRQSADEVRRSALLQLADMGAIIENGDGLADSMGWATQPLRARAG
jgi:nicotinamidase-related amidase